METKVKKPKRQKITFDQKKFSNDLFETRSKNNMSFEQVGKIVKLDKSAVFRIETGLAKNMTIRMLVLFCSFMDRDPVQYFIIKK